LAMRRSARPTSTPPSTAMRADWTIGRRPMRFTVSRSPVAV
jgi:hypothetical protein